VPGGWESTTLGGLGQYFNGRAFKKHEWKASGRPIIRIQNLTGSADTYNYFDGEIEERHVIRPGDLLVSWAATLGAYVWNGPEAVLNQHIFKVESNIDARFHKYLLNHKLSELMRYTHGSGMVHITRGKFDSFPVAVPAISEQRRIVNLLEDYLSRLDAAESYLKSAESRESVLYGRLLDAALADVDTVTVPFSSTLQSGLANGRSVPTQAGGFPVLRLTALRDGRIDLSARKEGAWTESDASRFLVERGDFLIARGNGSLRLVGLGGLVTEEPDAVAYPDTLIRARPDRAHLDPDYLALVWNSAIVRRQVEASAKTTAGIYKVNQKDLAAVGIPKVSLAKQAIVVARVRGSRDAVAVVAKERIRALTRLSNLRRSLLAAAFTGRLTAAKSGLSTVEELIHP
jgi:type I restriction enzyme S subunit